MSKVVHFEIPAERPERAVRFYEQVFGWKIEKWPGPIDYWLVSTVDDGEKDIHGEGGPGIHGAIHGNEHFRTVVNTIAVKDIDRSLEEVVKAGGKVLIPKGALPGRGYVSFAQDTEGNAFGLFQHDPSAQQ